MAKVRSNFFLISMLLVSFDGTSETRKQHRMEQQMRNKENARRLTDLFGIRQIAS